ncbi:lateral signaling target protein 2 homolog [Drosophila obscura]|uniref:lateral signaling target protein 2 homolog n=1 Tax=Drosophila obscura TaxID=7282 RepID=UPI001BB14C69|nr:lateral signaling target protein 2 homolog [Drosophila obscura]
MDPSTMWRLQEACQRNLVERQRIRKRLQHLTGKRSGELLCNDKNRHCQADDWPCLTSFGVADARERMGAPAPQPPSSGPKRARARKLKHSCNRYTGEMPPLELLVVGHQLPMHSLPMTTTRSHQPSEHLLQQHQHQQQQQKQHSQSHKHRHRHSHSHRTNRQHHHAGERKQSLQTRMTSYISCRALATTPTSAPRHWHKHRPRHSHSHSHSLRCM